jgi:hypothetical protein
VSQPLAASDLEDVLRQATLALERGDAPAAARAMDAAAGLCAEAERSGLRLPSSTLARARAAWERCGRAAQRHRAKLEASLLQLGTSRRAVGAYRRR